VYLFCIHWKTAMREAAITLRALPQQLDLINRAAQLLGKSRSDFVLEAACEKARSVVLDQVFLAWTRAGSSNSTPCWTPHPPPTRALSA
jgi:uncharacterized protein (DUF1778 family)